MSGRRMAVIVLVAGVAVAAWSARTFISRGDAGQATGPPANPPPLDGVGALGRLQPKDGVLRIAGPSRPAVVIGRLLVEEGQAVRAGDMLAVLDTIDRDEAAVLELEAELRNAHADLARQERLLQAGSATGSQRDTLKLKVDVTAARLRAARNALESDRVRAPIDGRVLAVHAHTGERVGPDGIVELGQVQQMYAVAEVYETDVGRVKLGQRAVVRSRALAQELHGTVERIGLTVGRRDALSTDPAADTDARVVEVFVRLDDGAAALLTNLQVEILIQTDGGAS